VIVRDLDKARRRFYERAEAMDVEIAGWTSHAIANSLHVKDPEGNTIEMYADVPLEEYNWPEQCIGFISRPFDIEAVPVPAGAEPA
jgi:catechol 2,3-dioxygenase